MNINRITDKQIISVMGKNPTLLTLLKQGCKIEFPLGYVLQGMPEEQDIREFEIIDNKYNPQGLWPLNANGVRLAMKDVRKYNSLTKLHNKLNKSNGSRK